MLGPQKFHGTTPHIRIQTYPIGAHFRQGHARTQGDARTLPPQAVCIRGQHRKYHELGAGAHSHGGGLLPHLPHHPEGRRKDRGIQSPQVSESDGREYRSTHLQDMNICVCVTYMFVISLAVSDC